MFTGLVEEIGILRSCTQQGEAMVLTIAADLILSDAKLGDSISVNGVCLTIIRIGSSEAAFDVMPETYRHSNLSQLRAGSRVNLERAMAANGRFGGHIVQGHADTFGTIVGRQHNQNAVEYKIKPEDQAVMKYVVPRGSITLDGISLTVVSADDETITVSIIPHTLAQTALQDKKPGDTVNIETDILGKYIEHLLGYKQQETKHKPLSVQSLIDNGFM